MIKKYNQLKQFFGSYFHQDWDFDGDTWEEVIANYLTTCSGGEIELLTAQLDDVIQDIESNKIDANMLSSEFNCDYNFDADGLSAIEWLAKINVELKGAISS